MATFYSIVFANIRPSVDERVSIALLLRDEANLIFHYAPDKLDALRTLLPDGALGLLRTAVRNLGEYIANPGPVNREYGYRMALEPHGHQFLERGYVDYLSRYNNNLLTFSEPKAIDVPVTEVIFEKLFQKYVYRRWEAQPEPVALTVAQRVRRDLFPRIEERVNLEPTLTNDLLPGLLMPTKVSFAGQNGAPGRPTAVVGQVIEFGLKKPDAVENAINRMLGLVRAFEADGKRDGKYFLIGTEPDRALSKQRELWQQVRQNSPFEVVPPDETERIDAYVDNHDVQPLFREAVAA